VKRVQEVFFSFIKCQNVCWLRNIINYWMLYRMTCDFSLPNLKISVHSLRIHADIYLHLIHQQLIAFVKYCDKNDLLESANRNIRVKYLTPFTMLDITCLNLFHCSKQTMKIFHSSSSNTCTINIHYIISWSLITSIIS